MPKLHATIDSVNANGINHIIALLRIPPCHNTPMIKPHMLLASA